MGVRVSPSALSFSGLDELRRTHNTPIFHLPYLLSFLEELHALEIDLYLHQQGVDTTTPAGKAMFQICGVFAEFEQPIIRERINGGLTGARSNGKRLGRPGVGESVERAIRQALSRKDQGIRKIAREMGVGVSVVQRVVAAHN